jgi:hypothetical protein
LIGSPRVVHAVLEPETFVPSLYTESQPSAATIAPSTHDESFPIR